MWKFIPFFLLALVSTACTMTTESRKQTTPHWEAGVAVANITPSQPIWMAGYGGRDKPAQGKINDLYVKALMLRDADDKRVVLLTFDIVGMDRETSNRIRSGVEQNLKLPRDSIAICCSHTHSGPVVGRNLRPAYPFGEEEWKKVRAYTNWLEETAITTAVKAAGTLRPATLKFGVGHADFAVNRRNNKEAEVAKIAAAPGADPAVWRKQLKGPVDHDLPVLVVTEADGAKPLAILFSYACHATVLSGYDWCSDWPGFACEEVAKANPGATAFFVQGCGADQNPLPRRKVEQAKGYGKEAATGVAEAMSQPMQSIEPKLSTTYGEIDLPFGVLPTRDELEKQKVSVDPKERAAARRASLLLERLARDGKLQEKYPYPIETWRLGNTGPTMVLLGGEAVVDYALRLKHELGGNTGVWPIAYANDVMAYIPSRRVLEEGGYEGGGAMIPYGLPAPWGATVEEQIMGEVHRQMAPTTQPSHK
jgi:hypothetical protein